LRRGRAFERQGPVLELTEQSRKHRQRVVMVAVCRVSVFGLTLDSLR